MTRERGCSGCGAVSEVFSHGRVEDGEVWTSLKRNNRNRKGNFTFPHSSMAVTCPQSPWAVSGGVGAPCRTLKCGKTLSHLFLLVSFLLVLLQGADPQDLVLCSSCRWPSLTKEP